MRSVLPFGPIEYFNHGFTFKFSFQFYVDEVRQCFILFEQKESKQSAYILSVEKAKKNRSGAKT